MGITRTQMHHRHSSLALYLLFGCMLTEGCSKQWHLFYTLMCTCIMFLVQYQFDELTNFARAASPKRSNVRLFVIDSITNNTGTYLTLHERILCLFIIKINGILSFDGQCMHVCMYACVYMLVRIYVCVLFVCSLHFFVYNQQFRNWDPVLFR